MDKNTITGLVLIFLLIVLWQNFFSPTLDPIENNSELIEAPKKNEELNSTPLEEQSMNPIDNLGSGLNVQDSVEKEEIVVLENEVLKIELSSIGGVIKNATLKEFEKRLTIDGEEQTSMVSLLGDEKNIFNYDLSTSNGNLQTHSVIIATGASAKWLGLPSEKRLTNKGVSACAVCDGFFYRGQEVAVVGGGDTAAEEATYLSKLCPKVHLLVRRDELRASKIMQERVAKTPNIEIHWNTEVREVFGNEKVTGIEVINNQTHKSTEIPATGLFVAIGHQPNTHIFKDWLEMDKSGYLITTPGTSKTKINGVFAGGDAQDKVYRQAVTAAGTGCMAALDAERYLAENGII
jgi:thioredoxin reductase